MWTRYSPASLDCDFREATFYRVVTCWYTACIVQDAHLHFIEGLAGEFCKEVVEKMFLKAYGLYRQATASIDQCIRSLIGDEIMLHLSWPLCVCDKLDLEGFRNATLSFAAYYIKQRGELVKSSFPKDVDTLEGCDVGRKLFYLHKLDREAPMVVEVLQHVAMCYITQTFVRYEAVVVQCFGVSGAHQNDRSASPFQRDTYKSIVLRGRKRAPSHIELSGMADMRKKTKDAIGEEGTPKIAMSQSPFASLCAAGAAMVTPRTGGSLGVLASTKREGDSSQEDSLGADMSANLDHSDFVLGQLSQDSFQLSQESFQERIDEEERLVSNKRQVQ